MLKIDLFIFDLDGTLIDSRIDLTNAVNYAREKIGLTRLTIDTVTSYIGDGQRLLLLRSLPKNKREYFKDIEANFRRYYDNHALEHTSLYPSVKDTLHHFKAKKMAVISNKPEKFCLLILKDLGIDDYFSSILGGDTIKNMKPHPESIIQTLTRLNTSPRKTTLVVDNPTDITALKMIVQAYSKILQTVEDPTEKENCIIKMQGLKQKINRVIPPKYPVFM